MSTREEILKAFMKYKDKVDKVLIVMFTTRNTGFVVYSTFDHLEIGHCWHMSFSDFVKFDGSITLEND